MVDRVAADMRIKQNNSLRTYIRLILEAKRSQRSIKQTDSAGPGVTTDPTSAGAPYDNYEIERGVDIHGYWYKSPGDKATGGNYRPDDPAAYIGMVASSSTPEKTNESDEDLDEQEDD